MMFQHILISTAKATLDDLRLPFEGPVTVELSNETRERIERAHKVITDLVARGDVIYGVNTGFGKLADRRISKDELLELQRRVVESHMVGVGPSFGEATVRGMMVVKLLSLCQGHSGLRLEVVQLLLDMINHDVLPVIPSQGSVGASGDLAPLSHMAGVMTGHGQVRIGRKTYNAVEGLRSVGLEPVELGPKEGVALINGVQASTALALQGLFAAEKVLNAAITAGALTLEATAGRQEALDARIQAIRGQVGQITVAASLRNLVAESEILAHEFEGRRLQDPYSLRCMPQVFGASLDLLEQAARVLEREANAVSDNPLVFPDDEVVLSGGNFHGEPVAFASDMIAMALCEIGSITERRTAMIVDTSMSGLPPFLVEGAGLNSGFLMAQVTSAALVAENKTKAFPTSVDSIPTSAGQEDHVSMATHGGVRLQPMAQNAAYVVAIELLAAAQGSEMRDGGPSAPALKPVFELVRARSSYLDQDRALANDMEAVAADILSGSYLPHGAVPLVGNAS
ncbi:histidine ammonia-lyase [Leucobacter chinensis]|uniref:histidine ammonia-lyase n=1 Tax=Leucobacter chinensis TaxID=2851010 RepID=UPI001C235946|nr:histidine ammonia-lyase [Leucobacter chinensis]